MEKVKFFCINLSSRKDRWGDCEKQFLEQGLEVQKWVAKPRPENRRFGAGLSHREIIEYAKKNNWECVGVFEDDIKFLTNNFITKCYSALGDLNNTDWYILYFGGQIGKGGLLAKKSHLKEVFQVKNLFEAHAVIYNSRFYDIYLRKHPKKYSKKIGEYYLDDKYRTFDHWYADYIQEEYPCYITKEMLVVQKDDFSDIENRRVWRKSRAEMIFKLYKYNLGWLAERSGKYIKFLINLSNALKRN